MGVHCQILIKKPKEGVHRAGKPVQGIIKYAVDEPTEYRYITLSLVGSGKCSWTVHHSKSSTTYVGTEDYIKQCISLLDNPGEPVTILQGVYEYPFQFMLPEMLPPSFKSRTCTISYLIKLEFEKAAFFSINKRLETELTVYGYVNPIAPEGPIIFGLEKEVFNLFSENRKINVKAEINKTLFTPGENAKLNLVITNDTDITDFSITTALQCQTVYTADCGTNKTETKTLHDFTTAIDGSKTESIMSTIVPIPPELYSVQHSRVMLRSYNIIVTLRLPIPHINTSVAEPIVVGERIGVVEQVQDIPDEDPPSYWDSVCEEKEFSPKKEHS